MGMRVLATIAVGRLDAGTWLEMARQEPPVRGEPHGCDGCPLRVGGEWEAGATAALASMSGPQRTLMSRRWGCHVAGRPCAGMRRLCAAIDGGKR